MGSSCYCCLRIRDDYVYVEVKDKRQRDTRRDTVDLRIRNVVGIANAIVNFTPALLKDGGRNLNLNMGSALGQI